jgi:hypothetical protein
MKRILIALALCLVMIGLIVSPAGAAATKVTLNAIGADPGSGFVVFNNTSGPNTVQLEMSLKGAPANTTYEVYVQLGLGDTLVGTVTTNKAGNANFHYEGVYDPQVYTWVGLGLMKGGVYQFGTGMVNVSW